MRMWIRSERWCVERERGTVTITNEWCLVSVASGEDTFPIQQVGPLRILRPPVDRVIRGARICQLHSRHQ